jgi:DNA gyrase subunit A
MDTILERNQINIEDEMRRSYLDYAMSVIIGRALPDVRDGLKPVHRRVLWAMSELGNTHNKPYKKSARVVGDTIGKYHPHGDTAAYDTIVVWRRIFDALYARDGQGNFGSIDGDSAAHALHRSSYAKIYQRFLADIEKETVDFQPNYDESFVRAESFSDRFPESFSQRLGRNRRRNGDEDSAA